jgi:hypothetical protein
MALKVPGSLLPEMPLVKVQERRASNYNNFEGS